MADRRLSVVLAVPLLVLGLGVSAMAQDAGQAGNGQAATDPGCRPPPPMGTVDHGGKDPQPTQAEVLQRLDQSGCAQGAVDASKSTGQQVDQLYKQLMEETAPAPATPGSGQ